MLSEHVMALHAGKTRYLTQYFCILVCGHLTVVYLSVCLVICKNLVI